MRKRYVVTTLSLAAACLALPFSGLAQTVPDRTSPNTVDRQFVQQAMLSNAKELKTADMERYSKNPSVRLFARTMIRDHGQSVAQLASLANQANIPYPRAGVVNVDQTTGGPSSATSRPNVAPNADNPRTYMQDEVADHQQAIALYENEMRNGNDEYLKAYAGKVLPLLKNHLAMAQQFMTVGRVTPEPTPSPCVNVPGSC
jgi:putative membrane protein